MEDELLSQFSLNGFIIILSIMSKLNLYGNTPDHSLEFKTHTRKLHF